MKTTEQNQKGVRLSVVVSSSEYERLMALKARRRTTTQELVSGWIREQLEAADAEPRP